MAPSNALQIEIQNLWNRINKVSGTLGEFNEHKDNLSDSNAALSTINQELTGKLELLTSEVEALQAEYSSATEKIASLEHLSGANSQILVELRRYEQELSELKIKHEGLKIDYNNSLNSADELKNQVEAMSGDLLKVTELQSERSELLSKVKQLEVQCADFEFSRQEIVRKNKDIFEKNNEIRYLRDRVSELDSKMFELNRLRDEFHQSKESEQRHLEIIQELNAQISMLNTQLEIEKKKIEDRTAEHSRELELLRKDYSELRKQYNELDKSKQDIVSVQLGLVRDVDKYQAIVIEKDEIIERLKSQVSELTDTADQYFNEIERLLTANDQIKILEGDNARNLNRIQELETDFADVQAIRDIINVKDSVIEGLNTEITNSNIKIDEIQADFDNQLQALKSEYNLLSEKNEAQHKQIAELMTAKTELSVQFKAISQYNAAYKDAIKLFEEKNLEFEKSKTYISDLENQVIELEDKLELINKQLDDKNIALSEIENLLESYMQESKDRAEENESLNSKITELLQDIEEKVSLLANKDSELNLQTEQQNNLKKELEECKSLQQEIESLLDNTKSIIGNKDKELTALNSQIQNLHESIDELESKDTIAQLEVMSLNEQLNDLLSVEAQLKDKINQLNDNNLRLIEAADRAETYKVALTELENSNRDLENERNALRMQSAEQNEQISVLLDENTAISEKYEQLRSKHESNSTELQSELAEIKAKYEFLLNEANNKNNQIVELKEEAAEAKRDNEGLKSQIDALMAEKSDQEVLIDIYSNDADSQQEKIANLENSIKEYQISNNDYATQIATLQAELSEQTKNIELLNEDIRSNNTRIEEMVLEREILEENLGSIIQNGQSKDEVINESNRRIIELNEEINALKSINTSFDAELKKLDEKIANLNNDKAEAKLQLSDAIGAKSLLENDLSESNRLLSESEKRNAELLNSKIYLESKISDLSSEIAGLNSDNISKKMRIEQSDTDLAKLNTQVIELNKELTTLRNTAIEQSRALDNNSELLEAKTEYEKQVTELNAEIEIYRQQLSENEIERNQFDAYYSEIKTKYQELLQNKDKSESNELLMRRENDALVEQIASIESQMTNIISDINSKEKQIESLQAELKLHKDLEISKDHIKSEIIDMIESYVASINQ